MSMRAIRIAFISDHASPLAAPGGVDSGGQNVYVAETALQLATQGYEVDIFTRRESLAIPVCVNWQPGIRVIHIKAGPVAELPKEHLLPYMDEFAERMLAFIRSEGIEYQLVHAHFFMSALVAAELKRMRSLPFVITFHALGRIRQLFQKERDRFPPERIDIEMRTAQAASRIIAECPQDYDDLVNHYRVDPAKISIVPCGFNPHEFRPIDRQIARKALGLTAGDFTVLQLGRIVPRKGIDNVIRAVGQLKQAGRNVRLLIVGGEKTGILPSTCPELTRLAEVAAEAQVNDQVTFVGGKSRPELPVYYAAADVFVTTPWYEPFGITPLEAMACGVPVIGANVGGIKFTVLDGKTGYLVSPNDPAGLAERISGLQADPELRDLLGKQAIAHVKQFTWNAIVARLTTVYQEVISESRSSKALGRAGRTVAA